MRYSSVIFLYTACGPSIFKKKTKTMKSRVSTLEDEVQELRRGVINPITMATQPSHAEVTLNIGEDPMLSVTSESLNSKVSCIISSP